MSVRMFGRDRLLLVFGCVPSMFPVISLGTLCTSSRRCLAAVTAPLLRLLWVCAIGLYTVPSARLNMVFAYVLRRNIALFCGLGCGNKSPPEKHSLFQEPHQTATKH